MWLHRGTQQQAEARSARDCTSSNAHRCIFTHTKVDKLTSQKLVKAIFRTISFKFVLQFKLLEFRGFLRSP